jgi:hypothetical protein
LGLDTDAFSGTDPHLDADAFSGTTGRQRVLRHPDSPPMGLDADALSGTNPHLDADAFSGTTGRQRVLRRSGEPPTHPTLYPKETTLTDSDDNSDNEHSKNTNPRHSTTHSDSEDSTSTNSTYRQQRNPRQQKNPTPTPPDGTLLHRFPCPTNNSDDDAEHILLWLDIMEAGPTAFEREIARNLRSSDIAPALFAILPTWSETVKLAHGFANMLLTNGKHWADGRVGFFLGDRIAVPLSTGCRLQDPRLVLTRSFHTLLSSFSGLPASEQRIKRNTAPTVTASTSGTQVTIHKLFPVPQSWWPAFLHGTKTPRDALELIASITRRWTSDVGKEAASRAQLWARSACTADERDPELSAVAIRVNVDEGDTETVNWATQHLQGYLPVPSTTNNTPPHVDPLNTAHDHPMIMMAQQTMQMAQSLIDRDVDRSDPARRAPKQLPEDIVCHLLGLCGLPWDDRDQLPKIWQSLHQQTDQKGRDVALRRFFQQLGETCPDLEHFHSSQLFDHIINHKFIPGDSYDTCHHGLSILALSLRSFSIQEHEQREDEYFREASNKTQDSIRKHKTKGPPALPTSIGELLLLLDRLIVLTKGLFTANSPMATQLDDLRLTLRKRHHTLMSDPRRTTERIPQLVWAIIKASRYFYSTVCTKEDLDPEAGDLLRLPTANLDAYTFLLKAELPIEVDGIPDQWLPTHKRPTPTHTTTAHKPTTRNDNQQTKQQSSNPFNPSNNSGPLPVTTHTFTNQPAVFATNETLRDLKTKRGRVLRDLFIEAGIPGGESGLVLTGLPDNICLRYLLLGQCHSNPRNECKRTHPTTGISREHADAVFKQIEHGLKRVADKNKRQRTE